jgi:hypothetical protein
VLPPCSLGRYRTAVTLPCPRKPGISSTVQTGTTSVMAPVVPLGIIDFTGTIRQSGVTWRRVAGDALVPDTMGQGSCHFLEWNFCCAFPSFTADRLPWSPHPCINTTLPYGKFYTVVSEPHDSLGVYVRLRVHGVTVA